MVAGRRAALGAVQAQRLAVTDPATTRRIRARPRAGRGWQRGQRERAAVHERLAADRRAAARAGAVGLPVRGQRPVEVARRPVHVDVQGVERRPALRQRLVHDLGGGGQHGPALRPGELLRRPGAVQPRPPQRLVRVDVADAGDGRLVEQRPLELGAAAADARRRRRRGRTRGPSGRGRCARSARAAGHRRRPATSGCTDSPPNVRWSTNRSSGPSSSNRDPDPQVLLVRPARGGDEHLAAHPEVREHRVGALGSAASCAGSVTVQLQPQVLAPAPRRGDRAPDQPCREVVAALEVAAHRARVGDVDVRDRAVDDVVGQAPPDDLDLGQLGHGRSARAGAVARRGLGRQGPPRELGGLLLGLLLGAAAARAQGAAADHRRGGEQLGVVGPLLGDPVLGDAEVRRRRQLLQAGLPVQARRRAAGPPAAASRTAGARPSGRSPGRAAGTPRRSAPRWRRRGCWSSSGRRSAPRRARGTGAPRARPGRAAPATPASACMLTTLARSLASCPSGRSGWSR